MTISGSSPLVNTNGFIAQLVERWIEAPEVTSSNLVDSTNWRGSSVTVEQRGTNPWSMVRCHLSPL